MLLLGYRTVATATLRKVGVRHVLIVLLVNNSMLVILRIKHGTFKQWSRVHRSNFIQDNDTDQNIAQNLVSES